MTATVYLIPILCCLALRFAFHYEGDWQTYVVFLAVGEAFTGLLNRIFYYYRTHATEFVGTLIRSIHYDEPWVEIVKRAVSRTDSKGRTYTTYVTDYVKHPERYYFYTTTGKNARSEVECNRDFFRYVCGRWGQPLEKWWIKSRRIKGGIRYGWQTALTFREDDVKADDPRWISVTQTHRYKNMLRNSDSIFRFRKISKEEAEETGLFDYPRIENYDIPCIMTQTLMVPLRVQEKFRRFNGGIAPGREMRLFILVFDSIRVSAAIAEEQRTYWQGGNMNEFILCLGVDASTGNVDWARAFSWAEPSGVADETQSWFTLGSPVDWDAFYEWFLVRHQDWQRREFKKDFAYLQVRLPLWQVGIIAVLSLLENAAYIYILLDNFQK